MQQIINYIRVNDLAEPIKSLTYEREQLSKKIAYSIYRDILFLACKVLGRAQIDINAFDKEYTMAYSRWAFLLFSIHSGIDFVVFFSVIVSELLWKFKIGQSV